MCILTPTTEKHFACLMPPVYVTRETCNRLPECYHPGREGNREPIVSGLHRKELKLVALNPIVINLFYIPPTWAWSASKSIHYFGMGFIRRFFERQNWQTAGCSAYAGGPYGYMR